MTNEELDRILSAEDRLEPSSTFTTKVMTKVYSDVNEVRTPFPWLWFAVGILASLAMAAAGAQVAAQHADVSVEYCCTTAALVIAFGLVSGRRIVRGAWSHPGRKRRLA